jgi:hypothetical protein
MKFSCTYGDVGFTPDHIFWRINGDFYEGDTVTHAFPVAGTYLVEVGLVKDMEFLGTVTACASREIEVEETSVWTSSLIKEIHARRAESKSGPFVDSEIVCLVTESVDGNPRSSLIPLQSLMGQIKLKEDATYELSLLAGSFVSEKTVWNTKGISGNDLYLSLKDVILALGERPFAAFSSLKLEENAAVPLHGALQGNADLLRLYSGLHVQCSYREPACEIHSGVCVEGEAGKR